MTFELCTEGGPSLAAKEKPLAGKQRLVRGSYSQERTPSGGGGRKEAGVEGNNIVVPMDINQNAKSKIGKPHQRGIAGGLLFAARACFWRREFKARGVGIPLGAAIGQEEDLATAWDGTTESNQGPPVTLQPSFYGLQAAMHAGSLPA